LVRMEHWLVVRGIGVVEFADIMNVCFEVDNAIMSLRAGNGCYPESFPLMLSMTDLFVYFDVEH
jgi:hypothetical protein